MELTKELYISPMYDRYQEKYGESADNCICCKRPIKDIDNCYYVHMNEGWKVLRNGVDETNCLELTGNRSQGCFPIGNDCAKKVGKDFIFKYSN